MIMAVGFAVSMRTERLVFDSELESAKTRHLVDAALNRALNEIDLQVGTNHYPLQDWIVSDGAGTVDTIDLNRSNLWTHLPKGVGNPASPTPARWITLTEKDTGRAVGRIGFAAVDCAGFFDANTLFDEERKAEDAQYDLELNNALLREFADGVTARDVDDRRTNAVMYASNPEFYSFNQDLLEERPVHLFTHSYYPTNGSVPHSDGNRREIVRWMGSNRVERTLINQTRDFNWNGRGNSTAAKWTYISEHCREVYDQIREMVYDYHENVESLTDPEFTAISIAEQLYNHSTGAASFTHISAFNDIVWEGSGYESETDRWDTGLNSLGFKLAPFLNEIVIDTTYYKDETVPGETNYVYRLRADIELWHPFPRMNFAGGWSGDFCTTPYVEFDFKFDPDTLDFSEDPGVSNLPSDRNGWRYFTPKSIETSFFHLNTLDNGSFMHRTSREHQTFMPNEFETGYVECEVSQLNEPFDIPTDFVLGRIRAQWRNNATNMSDGWFLFDQVIAPGDPDNILYMPFDQACVTTPGTLDNPNSKRVSFQVDDPRINWDFEDHWHWGVPETLGNGIGAGMNSVLTYDDPEKDGTFWMYQPGKDFVVYEGWTNRLLRSVADFGTFLYDENKPWTTMKLAGPEAWPVFEYFGFKDESRTNGLPREITRGLVNPNTLQTNVLASLLYRAPVHKWHHRRPDWRYMESFIPTNYIEDAGTARDLASRLILDDPVRTPYEAYSKYDYDELMDVLKGGTFTYPLSEIDDDHGDWGYEGMVTKWDVDNLLGHLRPYLSTRQNLFLVYLAAQSIDDADGDGTIDNGEVSSDRLALAVCWRDPEREQAPRVLAFRWL
ncbi:hypothetical protein L21SP4_00163 [Kiritimatiella glycovorans]|uniref:Uncharacterized protein n=2 Tax=Kiritimatiella glycovorans TaxID=1307763 RepID=A0A0G3EDI5_9BACT|nr:hypothetical protein L21SP4_00163 [Kiritimatiella glycovorans]